MNGIEFNEQRRAVAAYRKARKAGKTLSSKFP